MVVFTSGIVDDAWLLAGADWLVLPLDPLGLVWMHVSVCRCWGVERWLVVVGRWLAHCWVLKHQGQMLGYPPLCGVSCVVWV